jgi:hypothetical protein
MQISPLLACPRALLASLLLAPLLALAQGTVQHLSGTLSAQRPDGTARLLSEKSTVREGDVVTTGGNTYAQIRFTDGGRITLRPDSQIRIEGYRFEEKAPEKDSFLFALVKGGMRAVTGLISKRGDRDAYRLRTPTATVGIRGTDFSAINVPPTQPDAPPPGVYVTVADGSVVVLSGGIEQLVNPGQTAFSSSSNLPPQLVPPPPNLPQVTPPATFGGPASSTINSGTSADCLIQ